ASTPESLVGPSWRLRRLHFPTTPATAPSIKLVSTAKIESRLVTDCPIQTSARGEDVIDCHRSGAEKIAKREWVTTANDRLRVKQLRPGRAVSASPNLILVSIDTPREHLAKVGLRIVQSEPTIARRRAEIAKLGLSGCDTEADRELLCCCRSS